MEAKTKTFAEKMAGAMSDIGAVGKDGVNEFHRYRYTSAAAIQAKVQKALVKHGLFFATVEYEPIAWDSVKDRKGNDQARATIRCKIAVADEAGNHAHAQGIGCGLDAGDKHAMKACTAAFKYAISALFCIAMGDDPEADSDTDEATSSDGPSEDLRALIEEARGITSEDTAEVFFRGFGLKVRALPKHEQAALSDEIKAIVRDGRKPNDPLVTVAKLKELWIKHVMPPNYNRHNEAQP
jgi:hypothetical protein